jgi:hypothetical protein
MIDFIAQSIEPKKYGKYWFTCKELGKSAF